MKGDAVIYSAEIIIILIDKKIFQLEEPVKRGLTSISLTSSSLSKTSKMSPSTPDTVTKEENAKEKWERK